MSNVEDFLTAAQEQAIIDAIRLAEKNTSGEIRVHLESKSEKDPLARAKEVFYFLKMDKTKQQNGVLFYVAVDDKKFSVLGDAGINKVVPDIFWDSVKDLVLDKFKTGHYSEGLCLGIEETGKKLKEFFPYLDNDKNELRTQVNP